MLVLGQCLHVLRQVAAREQRPVNSRVQSLHATVQHLRKTRDIADVPDGDARGSQSLGGATRGNEIPAERR